MGHREAQTQQALARAHRLVPVGAGRAELETRGCDDLVRLACHDALVDTEHHDEGDEQCEAFLLARLLRSCVCWRHA